MAYRHANQILAALHIECQNESSRPATLSPINTQQRPSSTEPPSHSEVDPAHTRKGSSTDHSPHPHLRNQCAITHRILLGPRFTTTRTTSGGRSVPFTRKHLHRTQRSHPPTPSANVQMQPRRSLHSPARDAHSNHRTHHFEDTTTFTCSPRRWRMSQFQNYGTPLRSARSQDVVHRSSQVIGKESLMPCPNVSQLGPRDAFLRNARLRVIAFLPSDASLRDARIRNWLAL